MRPQVKGALYLALAMLAFATMSALTKIASSEVPFTEAAFFRGVVGLPVIALLAWRRKVSLKGTRKGLLLLRGVVGTVSVLLLFFAVSRIPVADSMLLNQMAPIFVLPMAALALRERITALHAFLVLMALAGAALVLRPNLDVVNVPGLAALSSALFAAVAYVTVRKLAGESSLTVVFWFTAISTLICLPLMLPFFVWPGPRSLAALIGMACMATFGQLLLTRAYRHGEAGRLAVIGSTSAIYGAVFDFAIWGHVPVCETVVGGVLVIAACSAIQMMKGRAQGSGE
ncbi:MAG: DMT family transporter [Deltaproteobacteria bacterium]|nr:DMT family transporter [Deltaproteobacteria bacterium]